jgi:uroporphyrinogen-III synthase
MAAAEGPPPHALPRTRLLTPWRILVTRPLEQATSIGDLLRKLGATPVVYPTIAVVPPPSWTALDAALGRLADYAWAIFTSPSAVAFTLARAAEIGVPVRSWAALRIAAVGDVTAQALEDAGLAVQLVPAAGAQQQEGLLDRMLAVLAAGERIFFPQALQGRELLHEELARRGFAVDVVPVSQTVDRDLTLPPPEFDVATFASPSALRAFVRGVGRDRLDAAVVAVIGKTTATAAAELGVRVDVMPASPSFAALIDAVLEFLDQRK